MSEPTGMSRGSKRLARPGAPGLTGIRAGRAAAFACLGLALLWLGFALVRPMPGAQVPTEESLPAVATLSVDRSPIEERDSALQSLRGVNFFAQDRMPWPEEVIADASDEAQEPTEPERPAPEPVQVVLDDIVIDDPETLPDNVKQALRAIALRGVRTTEQGVPVAMISHIHSGNQFAANEYEVGDEFTEQKHPREPWRVERINTARDQVVLHRSGKNVLLSMYQEDFAYAARHARRGAASEPDEGVEYKTRQEVVAELLEADISTQDIKELLDMIEQEPERPIASGPRNPAPTGARGTPAPAQPRVVAATDPAEKPSGGAPAPSEGMTQLLRMMMSGKPPERIRKQPEPEPSEDPEQ